MAKTSKRLVLRWVLAIVSLTIFLVIVPYTAYRYITTSKYFNESSTLIIPDRKYNDLTDGGIQAKLTLSNNMFQIGLLVTAALAGLLIAKKGEAGFILADAPEVIMFICTSFLLLLSFACNALYINEVSYIYSVAGKLYEESDPSIPDVFNENVDFLFLYQFGYLLSGVVLALFTFLSAHKIKGG